MSSCPCAIGTLLSPGLSRDMPRSMLVGRSITLSRPPRFETAGEIEHAPTETRERALPASDRRRGRAHPLAPKPSLSADGLEGIPGRAPTVARLLGEQQCAVEARGSELTQLPRAQLDVCLWKRVPHAGTRRIDPPLATFDQREECGVLLHSDRSDPSAPAEPLIETWPCTEHSSPDRHV